MGGGGAAEKEISSLSGSCQVDPEGRPDGDPVSGFPMCVLGNGGLKIAHPRLFLVSVPEWRLMFTCARNLRTRNLSLIYVFVTLKNQEWDGSKVFFPK